MLAGHFGLAAIVKSRQPQVPLWALMLSMELLDVLFLVLYFVGTESYKAVPGTGGGYGEKIFSADYSHSLVSALVMSLVVLIAGWIFWGQRNGLVLGVVVFSHWILDFVTHRGDLAILPGDATGTHVGLGLWSIPWAAILLELVLCLLGAYLYYHASMRTAVRLERQQGKSGPGVATAASAGYRQNALVATLVMLVLMVGTLVADALIA
jgi:membrane-bound metal-dependent hydrolase YbcI (DUF457 family)